MDPAQPRLVIEGTEEEGEELALGDVNALGREPENDIVVSDSGVSRNHAVIEESNGAFVLKDLQSTNGTFVNQQKLDDAHLLQDGDRIRLGASQKTLVFRHAATAVAEPEAAVLEAPPAATQTGAAAPAPSEQTVTGLPVPSPTGSVSVEELAPAKTEPAAEPPPTKSTFVALARKVRVALNVRLGKEAEAAPEGAKLAPSAREPDPDVIHEPALSPVESAKRLIRRLRHGIDLRRRPRTFTLSVERGVVRAVVFEGHDVVAWGMTEPQDGDESDSTQGPDEQQMVRSAIASLQRDLVVSHSRLVSDLPLYAPLVRHVKLPQIRKRYMGAVVASEVVESIPFTADEVDIKWQALPGDGESVPVAAMAVQKGDVDRHVQSFKDAGEGPIAAYSQSASLAMASGLPDVIILHFTLGQTGVVLARDGIPRAVYQVISAEMGEEEHADAIARAVEQIMSYNQSINLVKDTGPLPMTVTGRPPEEGNLIPVLQAMLEREFTDLSPPVDYPEGFQVSDFASNIGLALLDLGRARGLRRGGQAHVVSLNLLSPRHVPAPLPVVPALAFLVLALLGISMWPGPIASGPVASRISDTRNESIQAALDVKTKTKLEKLRGFAASDAEILEKEARQARSYALEMKDKIAGLDDVKEDLRAWFDKIHTITETTRPAGVIVKEFGPSADSFELEGTAPTFAIAKQYADRIRDSGLFVDVHISEVKTDVDAGGRTAPSPVTLPGGLIPGAGQSQQSVPDAGGVAARGGGIKFLLEASARPEPGAQQNEKSP